MLPETSARYMTKSQPSRNTEWKSPSKRKPNLALIPSGHPQTHTGSWVVDEIAQVNFEGNIIPNAWYRTITVTKKRPRSEEGILVQPDFLAISILADIVYWYRPSEVRDEETGATLGWRKKFKADKLHRRLSSFADRFGVSKPLAREALHRLRDQGLITIELRDVVERGQTIANNAMYIEPVPSAVRAATHPTVPDSSPDEKEVLLNSAVPSCSSQEEGYSSTEQDEYGEYVYGDFRYGKYPPTPRWGKRLRRRITHPFQGWRSGSPDTCE